MPSGHLVIRFCAASVLAAATVATGAVALHPAAAAAAISVVEGIVSCGTTAACVGGANTGTGAGVSGTSAHGIGVTASGVTGLTANGTTGNAITATTTSGYGVNAVSKTGLAVRGSSTSYDGVEGTSSTLYGVRGVTTSGPAGVIGVAAGGSGVVGNATTGYGVTGYSINNDGVFANSANKYGLYATSGASPGQGGAIHAYSFNADGLDVTSDGEGQAAILANDTDGNGTTIIAEVVPNDVNDFPFIAMDTNGRWLFTIDGSGNTSYRGSLINFATIKGGANVKIFTPKSAIPTLEDTGTAQLVNGVAAVRLDPTFAASIDPAAAYRVFITPGGDTNGVYVQQKTSAGFIVRENKGGRSTVSFDYRILATAAGHAGERIAVVPASEGHVTRGRMMH